jgi:hypothetical protein
MSQVIIAGDTSGTITLQAPAVAGSTTLTLPATTATLATLTTPSFASTIGVGGATASASGAGITFPATQSASSDANTLDDYEEGTWTPTITVTGTGSPTYGTQAGTYVKVGQLVTACAQFSFDKNTLSGDLNLSGFPFAAYNGNAAYAAGSMGYWSINSAVVSWGLHIGAGLTTMQTRINTAASTNANTTLSTGNLNVSGNTFVYSVTYRTTA